MKIGIAGPMSLGLLNYDFANRRIPKGYDFPLISFLINGLIKRGVRVVAYTMAGDIERPEVFESKDLTICVIPKSSHPGRDLFRSERIKLTGLMQKYPADLINAHWSYEYAWAALNSKIPTLVMLHDHAWTIFKYTLAKEIPLSVSVYWYLRFIINSIVVNKAEHLSVNSEYLLNLLPKRVQKKTRIIPNFYPCEIDHFNFKEYEEKKDYILTISMGFGRRKNITNGLKAFSLLRKYNPSVSYHLIGDGMELNGPAYLYAKKNNLTEGVEFTGRVNFETILNEIKNARAVLHPSREESFGMSVLESMVVGTPVVGGINSGNVPFLLDHGRIGKLCDIESPESIAEALQDIINNNEYSKKISISAQEHARKYFYESHIIDIYLENYKRIINNHKN